jgi:NADPH:quinone reductase-like Zn-dependent oxidoreductase
MENFGGLAEYARCKASALVKKPASLGFEQVAAIPQAGLVALQGLREGGKVKPGDRVLINGGGGGSGSYAIQLAKLWGAHVTAVDRTDKLEFMQELGADAVVDYTKEDFFVGDARYDVILDLVGRFSLFDVKRALAPRGRYCLVGGTLKTILTAVILGPIVSLFSSNKLGLIVVRPNPKDLEILLGLIDEEKIRPVVDKTYRFEDVRSALSYLGAANTRGKVVVTVGDQLRRRAELGGSTSKPIVPD